MSPHERFDYTEKRNFFGRFGFLIGVGAVGLVVVVVFSQALTKAGRGPVHKEPEVVMVRPLGPTPPPPPPPPPQVVPRQEMMRQDALTDQDVRPEDQAQATPANSLGTNLTGNGPADGFGLGRRDQGIFAGGGTGGAGGSGASRFGWYAAGVVQSVSEALRRNPATRNAQFDVRVRIWADLTGRVTRARLARSTGDPVVDDAITNRILAGFQLQQPPPDGMPMPIVMRLTARRPQ